MKAVDASEASFYVVSRGHHYLMEPSSQGVWTTDINEAKHFNSLEEASSQCCDNEYPKGI